jgi:hypothetical protein
MAEDLEPEELAGLEETLAAFRSEAMELVEPEDEDPGGDVEEFLAAASRKPTPIPSMVPLTLKGDLQPLVLLADPLEKEANKVGIRNVFVDNGYPTLVLCSLFGLRAIPGKQGDDAVDEEGRTFELKTVNRLNGVGLTRSSLPGVCTEATLTEKVIDRYRQSTGWVIGVFEGHHLKEVWQVASGAFEPQYRKWVELLRAKPGTDLNNPKIPFKFVKRVGQLVYSV